jgi:NADPH:quinone reductase-like Zn-dependent oxidoreductase
MAQNNMMRAVRFHDYGGPEQLVVEQMPVPQAGPDSVLVRIKAAGVNPVDWKLRSGALRQYMPVPLPAIPGRDLAGTVVEVGAGVTAFQAGQAVYGMAETGSYAEYAVAAVKAIAPKPERLTFDEAASVPVGAVTAWRALFDAAQIQAGQRVLIQGAAGGVGLFAVQLARWKGAHVIGTASGANQDYVRSLGAETVINYQATEVASAVHDVDVVVDTVGGNVLESSYQLVRPGGVLVTIAGRPDEKTAQERGIRVASLGPIAEEGSYLRQMGDLFQSGELKTYVGKVLPLSEAAQAQALSETGHGRGHIVLHVAG